MTMLRGNTPIWKMIEGTFESAGNSAYFGEAVTQTEHALQAAHLARAQGAADSLVLAALLHDMGHMLSGLPESAAQDGIDDRHEEAGAAWLRQHFPLSVTMPVQLHVAAKRYLCAIEPVYMAGLSAPSRLSLQLQGGPFAPEEARAFESLDHAMDAVRLRRWDDGAKVPGWQVASLEAYRGLVERLALD